MVNSEWVPSLERVEGWYSSVETLEIQSSEEDTTDRNDPWGGMEELEVRNAKVWKRLE